MERVRSYLAQVQAYRASGKKAKVWAAEHGVALRSLASWCAHAARWQAKLDGVVQPGQTGSSQFVRAVMAPALTLTPHASVRIELLAGPQALALHWPLAHTRELAQWLAALREARP